MRLDFPGGGLSSRDVAIAPPGTLLAAQFQGSRVGLVRDRFVRIWRTSRLEAPETIELRASGGPFVFSTDGHLLTCGVAPPVLWDVSAARDLLADLLPLRELYGQRTMLSPDDRVLLLMDRTGRMRLWEIASNEQIACFEAGKSPNHVIFSPDGSGFITFFREAPPLVWSLRPEETPPAKQQECESSWRDLGISEPGVGRRAIWQLILGGESTIRCIRHQLRPERLHEDKCAESIRQLNSADFDVRQNASKELAELGPSIEPRLREELARSTSAEVRQRLLEVLAGFGSKSLRLVRAVEVLERTGTPEAKEVLRSIAAGAAGAPETRAARNAILRMARGWRSPVSYLDVRR